MLASLFDNVNLDLSAKKITSSSVLIEDFPHYLIPSRQGRKGTTHHDASVVAGVGSGDEQGMQYRALAASHGAGGVGDENGTGSLIATYQ